MPKFTIHDTGVFRTDPFLLLNRAGIPVAQSYSEIGKFDSDGLLEIVDYIADLESRLREAEAIIKPIAEHDAKWAGVGEVAIFLPPEHYARAAAFLAGGDTNKV